MRRFDTGNGNDVAGAGLGHLGALQPHEAQHLEYASRSALAVAVDDHHLLVGFRPAALDAAHGDGAHVAGIVEAGHLHLKRAFEIHVRRRHVLDDGVEQRRHVAATHVRC